MITYKHLVVLVMHLNYVCYLVLNNLSELSPLMKMKMLRANYLSLEINPVMKLTTLRRLEGRHVDQFSVSRNVLVTFTCNWASTFFRISDEARTAWSQVYSLRLS